MAGPAVLFREIHRLRRFAHDLKEQLDRFPLQARAQQAKVKRQEDAKHDEHETIKKLKVTIHEQEVSLKANNTQIKKHEGQLSEISSKKEYDALLAEIAAGRKKSQQLEDEILAAMTEVEERTAKLPEFDQNVVRAQEEFGRWEKTAKGRQAEQTAELAATSEKLKAAEAQIPEKVRPQYSRMVASMGHEAMAAVKNHTCSHCSIEITAQNYNDLLQEQFVVCKSCGRILYLPEPTSPVV
jgi:predicted  nucleic acid-binding Zn-ribbon protein